MIFKDARTWVFYYLICFVALLWVGFLAVQGVMIFASLFITMIVFGFSGASEILEEVKNDLQE